MCVCVFTYFPRGLLAFFRFVHSCRFNTIREFCSVFPCYRVSLDVGSHFVGFGLSLLAFNSMVVCSAWVFLMGCAVRDITEGQLWLGYVGFRLRAWSLSP